MKTLSYNDLHLLNHVVGEIYAARDVEAFYRAVFASIQSVIPSELSSFSEIGFNPTRSLKVIAGSTEHSSTQNKFLGAFNAHHTEHPLTPHCYSGKVVKVTDYTSRHDFKNTAIHNEYYRHLDIDTQISFALPFSPDKLSLFTLSRKSADFSERDRLVLTLLRSHLITALRNVTELEMLRNERDLLQQGERFDQRGAVLFQHDGLIVCITAFARELLQKYFAVSIASGEQMPDAVLHWLHAEADGSESINRHGDRSASALAQRVHRKPLRLVRQEGTLTAKLTHDVLTGDWMFFLAEIPPPELQLKRLEKYGLSLRETEVLFWFAKGKTSAETALLLSISKRTVEKHTERIFVKLGVETRAAAVSVMQQEVTL